MHNVLQIIKCISYQEKCNGLKYTCTTNKCVLKTVDHLS